MAAKHIGSYKPSHDFDYLDFLQYKISCWIYLTEQKNVLTKNLFIKLTEHRRNHSINKCCQCHRKYNRNHNTNHQSIEHKKKAILLNIKKERTKKEQQIQKENASHTRTQFHYIIYIYTFAPTHTHSLIH